MLKFIQGDVVVRKIDNLPANLNRLIEKDQKGNRVLQHSEVTGHHHHFLPDAKVDMFTSDQTATSAEFTTITPNEGKFIVVHEDTILYHGKTFEDRPNETKTGDHNSLTIPAGTYQIDIVREYDYESRETTRVVD